MSMNEKDFLIKSYLSKTISGRDLLDDAQRVSRVCSIISKDDLEDDGRLLLNQLITLCNVFFIGNMLVILEEKLEPEFHEKLYALGVAVGFLEYEDFPTDDKYLDNMSEVLNEDERYVEIFKSFCGRRRWG